jgi:hypothetical protein
MTAKDETVVCAALKYEELVIPCIRHFDEIAGSLLDALGVPDNADIEQGFLTSHRRFLSRSQAKEMAILRGQVTDNNDDMMFSEDLY